MGQDCCNMAEGLNLTLLTEKAGGFLYWNGLIGKVPDLGKIEGKTRRGRKRIEMVGMHH